MASTAAQSVEGRPPVISILTAPWFYVLLAFIAGSLPFSVVVGRLALDEDIRRYGDGNPGATNVFRAGGLAVGLLAAALDGLKGALPVALASWQLGLETWWIVPVALAPMVGHAFSPFLGGRGGKAVAVTVGVWTGLAAWQAPVVLVGLLVAFYVTVAVDGWAVLFMMAGFAIYLVLALPSPFFYIIWAGNSLLLAWKHRAELQRPPGLRIRTFR